MSTKAKRVYKKVVYKRVDFHASTQGKTLKALLESALKQRHTLGLRRQNVAEADNPIYHALGSPHVEPNGFVFGSLMTYTPGTDPLCFIDDEHAEVVTLEKVSAPQTDDGKRREFLASMMFFGVIGNHLVLMQSQALKSIQLEAYLRWYLHAAEVLEGTNTLNLIDTPTEKIRQKMNEGKGVKSIKLGGEVVPTSTITPPPRLPPFPSQATEEKTVHMPAHPHVQQVAVHASALATEEDYGVLAALKKLMSPSQAAKIDFDKLAGSNIEMSVTLKYNRKTSDDGQELMDTLGVALRNNEDIETEIVLNKGGSIKGADLKMTGQIGLTSYDGQLNASEVYEGLRQWLLEKVSSEELPTS